MARRGPLHDVELVEDEGDDAVHARPAEDASGPTERRSRRPLVLGAALLVVLLAVGVVGQVVVERRERARLAAVAALPWSVDLLSGPPRVLWETDDVLGADVRLDNGLLVGMHDGVEGPVRAMATDPATGREVWQRELLDRPPLPDAPPGTTPHASGGWCDTHPGDANLVACLAHDMAWLDDEDGSTMVPATAVRLVVLDGRDGSVVTELTEAAGLTTTVPTSVALVADLLVVTVAEDDASTVRALTWEGSLAWETTEPSTGGTDEPETYAEAMGDLVAVTTPTELRLLDTQGRVKRTIEMSDRWAMAAPGGRLFLVPRGGPTGPVGSVETIVVGADGEVTVTGDVGYSMRDDGSVPGLVLTDLGGTLVAWDGQGERLWASKNRGRTNTMVLDGMVLVQEAASVVALDAGTGEEQWTSDAISTLPVTDGRHLLGIATAASRGVSREMVALDPADGSEMWRTPLPDGVSELTSYLRLLLAVEPPSLLETRDLNEPPRLLVLGSPGR